jgi:hypothetical protein
MGIVPNGPVTMVQEVQQIYDAFALTFMDGTAQSKQKCYMVSGSIQKPKSWSLRQVATRLKTLNHYLPYLPGTGQSFLEDEMKDMLVNMYSPVYHHLMARANYDVDAHSYLEITQYLQYLGLIEESFNKGNGQHSKQGNSKPKAHKAHKHQKKHGKNQCRKHPDHDHTWADCFDNPKGKNCRGNKNATHNNNNRNKNQVKKAEARVPDVDLDADMDCTLTIINLNEEVSNKTVELQDSKPCADNTVPPLPPSTVNNMKVTKKRSVTFTISTTIILVICKRQLVESYIK